MKSANPSPAKLLLILFAVVCVAVAAGIAVHSRMPSHLNVTKDVQPPQVAKGQGTLAPAPAIGRDWIGFHNAGPLLGDASSLKAPPMKLRWSLRAGDEEDAASATGPTTAPTTSPTTGPKSAPVIRSPGHFEAGAAIVGGAAYIGDSAGAVRAIDLVTGKVRWTFRVDSGFETTPLVVGGLVFLGDLDGVFHAIAADTGRQTWSFDTGGGEIHASANILGPARDRIVFATDDGAIFCLNAAKGTKIWEARSGGRVNSVPAVANGLALVSGCDAQLRGVKIEDGTEIFSADLGAYCPGSPAVSGEFIVCGTDEGHVICISAKTHLQLWLFTGIAEQAMVYGSPAIADGIVVAGARDHSVYGLDLKTGNKLWSYATRGEVDSSPVISDGRVYIGSKDKKLYVLDLKTGNMLWSFTAGRGISASPAIGDGVLVIGDEGGHLFCLE